MAYATDEDIAVLSKSELLRLMQRMRKRWFLSLGKADVLEVQYEEAQTQAMAAFDAYLAATKQVIASNEASMRAMQAAHAALAKPDRKNIRRTQKAMETAYAHANAMAAEKDRLWATHKRLERRAEKLWKQLDAEWERGRG